MDILNPFPQVGCALQKSLGLWLGVWAIRYNAGVDYKLSTRGRAIRGAVVLICFALTSVPGANVGWFRVFSYFAGLDFLCWPNLAYHLSKLFEEWPTAEGQVDSVQQKSASRWMIAYDFEVRGERYGGHDSGNSDAGIKAGASSESTRILIRYDPLNPGRASRIQRER